MSIMYRILTLLIVSAVWGFVCWKISRRYSFKCRVSIIFAIFAFIWCVGSIALMNYDSSCLNLYLGFLDGLFLGSGALFIGKTSAPPESR